MVNISYHARRKSKTTTGTITGKDTNQFSEGHETKPYLGERKTGLLGEKITAFLRGQPKPPFNYNWPSRDGPKARDSVAFLTKSISGWYSLNIRGGLEKPKDSRLNRHTQHLK